ncbi:Predicted membrane-bound metal-dependent hydrolase family protein [Candidatus Terasakiella magnetica]|uniref:Predicted membrane-bound metal-dependent hydrolase family protein n=1 Tax=Candidatus Terasakiella magnetica TaxID=1867952 RepID=A0A1C3RFV4_9PROT|nr:metal-dependent hydrolase [Candidatus Terasakiella magnetica]SCA56139.1 Predicted membrane-bound metal-dependent hydrolase family protein [Candidatus Terasakiella magnetica]
MDPLSQGVVGAILPQSTHKRSLFLWAGLFGMIGGMVPDLDTFIRSNADPLIYLEYHRQFTHSLVFIPFGGLICAGLLHIIIGRRKSLPFKMTYLFCTLGYATHGLLDAMTSYGTQLLWPFSDARIAWSYISIVDPLFTLPILILGLLCIFKNKALYARIALCWGMFYLSLGALQNSRAHEAGLDLAAERGHAIEEISVKPSFGNLLVWKTVYQHNNKFYVDAVRTGWELEVFKGTSMEALNIERDFPWLDKNTQQAKDIERFRWFSNGYLAKDPEVENRIIDLRYSFVPNQINALWSIGLSKEALSSDHVRFLTHRKAGETERNALLKMIIN